LIKDRIRSLFSEYDPALQRIIHDVLLLEQEYISYDRPPKVKEPIDAIVLREAKMRVEQDAKEEVE
jgi:hypothetical protein